MQANVQLYEGDPGLREIKHSDFVAFITKYPHVYATGQSRIDFIDAIDSEGTTMLDAPESDIWNEDITDESVFVSSPNPTDWEPDSISAETTHLVSFGDPRKSNDSRYGCANRRFIRRNSSKSN